ncbi:hypothetical protein LTR09_009654 [Extremus antarcticus]|uniref:Uncharacterized protein n=1 Tax=Extremus antarcticus TaxID=702011 RepID=A0AAJ0DEZ9_9PEZI|nr:hypothetical protein LTR09_009654 [Extremus antarcticus]
MSPRSIYCELDSEDKLNEMYEKMEDPETKAKEFFSKYGEGFEVNTLRAHQRPTNIEIMFIDVDTAQKAWKEIDSDFRDETLATFYEDFGVIDITPSEP